MTSGGKRNRNQLPDPDSERSIARGYALTALPSKNDGPIPDFPLPDATDRELTVWEQAWRTPQACAWSMPSEQWRIPTVALWVRVKVRCEAPDAGAALYAQLHRFADQIGMTTAGLAEMGWKVAVDQTAEKRTEKAAEPDERPKSSRDRMKVVKGDGA